MDDSAKICAQHGGEVEGFETPEECRSKGYTCPSCAEGDHRNCTRLTCVCVCDDGMTTAMGYLWKQRAQMAADALAAATQRAEAAEGLLLHIRPILIEAYGDRGEVHGMSFDTAVGDAIDLIAAIEMEMPE